MASDLSGRVILVEVKDNAVVKAGDVLFRLDPEPLPHAVNQADATLSAARLSVAQLKAAYDAAMAQQTLAHNDIIYCESELIRQQSLTDRGVSPTSDLDDAVHAVALAREQRLQADVGVQGALAALGGDAETPVDDHPAVQAANAARDNAIYNLGLATVRAPADGIVSQAASFQSDQYFTGGAA